MDVRKTQHLKRSRLFFLSSCFLHMTKSTKDDLLRPPGGSTDGEPISNGLHTPVVCPADDLRGRMFLPLSPPFLLPFICHPLVSSWLGDTSSDAPPACLSYPSHLLREDERIPHWTRTHILLPLLRPFQLIAAVPCSPCNPFRRVDAGRLAMSQLTTEGSAQSTSMPRALLSFSLFSF